MRGLRLATVAVTPLDDAAAVAALWYRILVDVELSVLARDPESRRRLVDSIESIDREALPAPPS